MEMATDIFGKVIERGTVIAYAGTDASIRLGVVDSVISTGKGELIGYRVVYPHTPNREEHFITKRDHVAVKKTVVRASRELIAVPASWLGQLQSEQASKTHYFSQRLQYLVSQYEKKKDCKPKYGPDVFFSQGKDGPDDW